MKKFYFFALSVFVAATAAATGPWDGTASTWTEGNGSESTPYIISTPSHLAFLAEQVNAGATYEGVYFRLTTDLDMGADAELKFPVIGKYDTYVDGSTMQSVDNSLAFMGTLDGDYHVIDNLSIEYLDEELGGTGLFAVLRSASTIKNLTLGSRSHIKGDVVTGAFVGQMLGGVVENCANEATIDGGMFTGGFVGCIEGGCVERCVNRGAVTGATEVGGIVGQGAGNGYVAFCYNTAAVTAVGFGGAGIGGCLYEDFSIANCYNIGAITGNSNPYMGSPHAIVSDLYPSNTISDCLYVSDLAGCNDINATAVTADDLKGAEALATLNGGTTNFSADTKSINDGFPVLTWEVEKAGVDNILNDNRVDFSVNGRNITASQSISVVDLKGRVVATGTSIALPASGLYIVVSSNGAAKVQVH